MASPLQIGPLRVEDEIAPANPDEVGMIAGPAGARYDALNIIEAVAADAQRLRPALALPPDMERSAVITQFLPYVNEIVQDAYPDLTVEGASVRGTGADESARLVVYTARHTSTRSTKGVMPYSKFPRVEEAYQAKVDQDLATARAARATGGSETEFGEDPRVRVLRARLSEVEAELRAQAEVPSPGPLPPLEGYDEMSVDEVRARVEAVSDLVEREILKREIRAYEATRSKPRKGIEELTEPVRLVPASEG